MYEYTEINLGKSLKISLITTGYKQDDVAAMLGVSKQQVSVWATKGGISVNNISRISRALGLKVSEFIALGERQAVSNIRGGNNGKI